MVYIKIFNRGSADTLYKSSFKNKGGNIEGSVFVTGNGELLPIYQHLYGSKPQLVSDLSVIDRATYGNLVKDSAIRVSFSGTTDSVTYTYDLVLPPSTVMAGVAEVVPLSVFFPNHDYISSLVQEKLDVILSEAETPNRLWMMINNACKEGNY